MQTHHAMWSLNTQNRYKKFKNEFGDWVVTALNLCMCVCVCVVCRRCYDRKAMVGMSYPWGLVDAWAWNTTLGYT